LDTAAAMPAHETFLGSAVKEERRILIVEWRAGEHLLNQNPFSRRSVDTVYSKRTTPPRRIKVRGISGPISFSSTSWCHKEMEAT